MVADIFIIILSEKFFNGLNCLREYEYYHSVFCLYLEVTYCDEAIFASDDAAYDSTFRHIESVDRFVGYGGSVAYHELYDVGVDAAQTFE
jgi:hypothetical protein